MEAEPMDDLPVDGTLEAIRRGKKGALSVREEIFQSLSDFLLPEALALLLKSPGRRVAADSSNPDSKVEPTETPPRAVQSKLVHVRKVLETQSLIEVVDRSSSLRAFVPQSVRDSLKARYGFEDLSGINHCVVRLERYHFSTYERCSELDHGNQKPRPLLRATTALVVAPLMCLCIEELSLVDACELRVRSETCDLLGQAVVQAILQGRSREERDQLFCERQVLPASHAWAAPSNKPSTSAPRLLGKRKAQCLREIPTRDEEDETRQRNHKRPVNSWERVIEELPKLLLPEIGRLLEERPASTAAVERALTNKSTEVAGASGSETETEDEEEVVVLTPP